MAHETFTENIFVNFSCMQEKVIYDSISILPCGWITESHFVSILATPIVAVPLPETNITDLNCPSQFVRV